MKIKKPTTKQLKQTAFYLASLGLFAMAALPVIKSDGLIGAFAVIVLYYSTYFIGIQGIHD